MRKISDQIVGLLTPVIGPGLANATVTIQCRKIGILTEELSGENLDLFVVGFKKMMAMIAGEQIAVSLAEKIREMK